MVDELASVVDSPSGRTESVLSSINGELLSYFTPHPLQELLDRSRVHRELPTFSRNVSLGLSLALARVASKRGLAGEVDKAQAARLCAAITGQRQFCRLEDILALGGEISPKAKELREEIVFAGARVASRSRRIFAPYGALPELMRQLEAVACLSTPESDPAALVAIAGFYCTAMHPFMDGNGRWTRVVAASIGAKAGAPLLASINVVMQNVCKKELADWIWPQVEAMGMRNYLGMSLQFERELISGFRQSGVLEFMEPLVQQSLAACRARGDCEKIITRLLVHLEIPRDEIRELLGSSNRSTNGWIERIERASQGLLVFENDRLRATELALRIDEAIVVAKLHALQTGDSGVESITQ